MLQFALGISQCEWQQFLQPRCLELSHNQVGPSGVRALPLAAGINVGGHYFGQP